MFNFEDIANLPVGDVKPVPLPPVGTYRWRVSALPKTRDFTGRDGTEYQSVEFPVQVVAPLDDVDPADYPGDLTEIRQTVSFMFDKSDEVAFTRAQNAVKRFLVATLQCGDDSQPFRELFNNAVNQQFIAPIQWKPRKDDPEVSDAVIGRPMPLD